MEAAESAWKIYPNIKDISEGINHNNLDLKN